MLIRTCDLIGVLWYQRDKSLQYYMLSPKTFVSPVKENLWDTLWINERVCCNLDPFQYESESKISF